MCRIPCDEAYILVYIYCYYFTACAKCVSDVCSQQYALDTRDANVLSIYWMINFGVKNEIRCKMVKSGIVCV